MVCVDSDGCIVLVNGQAELLFGYERGELAGQLLECLVPEPARPIHPRHRGAYFSNPITRPMGAGHELTGRRKDGTEFPVEISLSSMETIDGMLVSASVRDITNHGSVEAKFQGLMEAAPDAIVTVDTAGIIRLVNRQSEALFGYQRDELVGKEVEVLVPGRVNAVHPENGVGDVVDAMMSPLGPSVELSATRKDGTEFPVDISLSSLDTEAGVLVSATVRDVSDRKRTEAEFEGLVETAPDAIVAVGPDGMIHLVNRQAESLFGYTREELVGQAVEVLVPARVLAGHPADRARYMAHPTTRPMGARLDLAARRKDGTEFPVDISLSSFETNDGVLVSVAVRDITDRKRIEAEQSRLESELQRVQRDEERAGLEAELHQANRLESIGQLAGGIAHDFNNLLAGIMNYAALVAAGLNDLTGRLGLESDEAAVTLAQDVAEITNVATRAAELTHQLLIFSHREVVKPEVLDLNAIVADMEKLLHRTIGEAVDLRTELDPVLPRTRADRGQIEQVLMNLAVNARDAMAGSGRLGIETATFEADAEYARHHGLNPGLYVRLTVSDTGPGLPPEVASRAFEPFFSTKTKGEGSGLGLATVYGIVTQAGGDVVIFSEPGFGATVRVDLPATQDDATPARPDPSERPLTSKGETILLVEDEDMVREPARRMLARCGYTVLAAPNAQEALRIARAHTETIALLLTDVVMPGRSGKQLAADLAELGAGPKVLFMSGYSQDVIVHQGVLEEGVNLIEKPFAAENLLRKVREVLDEG
jgi:two-component system, cell cycle sensor histidine kinase and response regulator CckA